MHATLNTLRKAASLSRCASQRSQRAVPQRLQRSWL